MVMGLKGRHSITPRRGLPGDGNLPGMDGDVSATKSFDRSAAQAHVGYCSLWLTNFRKYLVLQSIR